MNEEKEKIIYIEKLIIKNFKCFKDFEIDFNPNTNIIVGNNDEGKSTILEAIHLCLSGMYNGQPLKYNLSEYLFNNEIKKNYINAINNTTKNKSKLPEILIELYLKEELQGEDNSTKKSKTTSSIAFLQGNNNSKNDNKKYGISYKICFDEDYINEYEKLVNERKENLLTIPIEYYKVEWMTFAREMITSRRIPLKSVIIDASSHKYKNGSDIYISRIIKDNLTEKEQVEIAQAYRKLKENFKNEESIKSINNKINDGIDISDKKVNISVDMAVKDSWNTLLMTYIEDIPFHQIGKGEQCIIKTSLALNHDVGLSSNVVLLEEPENHLSHSKLHSLTKRIEKDSLGKQLIITTHSNYIINKLNLDNVILLSNKKSGFLKDLPKEDTNYFNKLPGYETLRLILSKSAILVEGPSDELIVQKAFLDKYSYLPIEKEIDVISVNSLAFKRFLSLAKTIDKKVAVITDNDGDYEKNIQEKYKEYQDNNNIKIFSSGDNNLKTLEPQFLEANQENREMLENVFNLKNGDLLNYMTKNKTEWALTIFNSNKNFLYPAYINDAIDFVYETQE